MTDQAIIELQPDELDRLTKARAWLRGHFTDERHAKYGLLERKLDLIDAIISNNWVERDETWKLQALGVCFGDAIAQKLMMEWVTVIDDYGRDPALRWPGTFVICFPLTMISKRVENGEAVNATELFDRATKHLTEMAFSGNYL